jgi:hypothetical protein
LFGERFETRRVTTSARKLRAPLPRSTPR